jgi:hypothetical protein
VRAQKRSVVLDFLLQERRSFAKLPRQARDNRTENQHKETVFLSHLYIKVIFLPRQARDKHRENSKKPSSSLARSVAWRQVQRVRGRRARGIVRVRRLHPGISTRQAGHRPWHTERRLGHAVRARGGRPYRPHRCSCGGWGATTHTHTHVFCDAILYSKGSFYFTKTGSGQTSRKLQNRGVYSYRCISRRWMAWT